MTVVFTKAPFEDTFDLREWPIWNARYTDLNKVRLMNNQLINTIIDNAPIKGGRASITADIRTQFLEPGYLTAASADWHLDLRNDPDALLHIYAIGNNRTEFEDVNGHIRIHPPGCYATYTSTDWHRAVEVQVEEYRLFVRIQETNIEGREYKKGLSSYYAFIHPKDGNTYAETEEEAYNRFNERLKQWAK